MIINTKVKGFKGTIPTYINEGGSFATTLIEPGVLKLKAGSIFLSESSSEFIECKSYPAYFIVSPICDYNGTYPVMGSSFTFQEEGETAITTSWHNTSENQINYLISPTKKFKLSCARTDAGGEYRISKIRLTAQLDKISDTLDISNSDVTIRHKSKANFNPNTESSDNLLDISLFNSWGTEYTPTQYSNISEINDNYNSHTANTGCTGRVNATATNVIFKFSNIENPGFRSILPIFTATRQSMDLGVERFYIWNFTNNSWDIFPGQGSYCRENRSGGDLKNTVQCTLPLNVNSYFSSGEIYINMEIYTRGDSKNNIINLGYFGIKFVNKSSEDVNI